MTYTEIIVKKTQKVILSVFLVLGTIALVFFYRSRSTSTPLVPVPSTNTQEAALGENWQEAGFYRFLDTPTDYEYEVMGTVAGYDEWVNAAEMKEHIMLLDVGDGKQLQISLGNDEYYHQVYDEAKAKEGVDDQVEQVVSQSYPANEITSTIPEGQKVLVRYSVEKENERTLKYYQEYLENVRNGADVEPVIFDFAKIKMIVVQL